MAQLWVAAGSPKLILGQGLAQFAETATSISSFQTWKCSSLRTVLRNTHSVNSAPVVAGTERGGMGDANERGKFLRKGVDMGADRRDPVGGKGFGDELQLRGVSQIWGLTSPAQAKGWFVSVPFPRLCRGRCEPRPFFGTHPT